MSDSLRPHKSQHTRPPCPAPTPGVHSDSRPSSQWCHLAISSSVVPLSSCPQSLPASESSNESTLRMRWPKYWSFSFSISPSKEIPGLISVRMEPCELTQVWNLERSCDLAWFRCLLSRPIKLFSRKTRLRTKVASWGRGCRKKKKKRTKVAAYCFHS